MHDQEIPARLSGKRLDEILHILHPEHSRSALQKMVRRGDVKLNGKRVVRSNIRPGPRARVRLDLHAESQASQGAQAAAQLRLIHDDEHLLVFDKPAGMLTHSNEKSTGASLADEAVQRFGQLPLLMGAERPGVVHRLDRETSGVIVLARTGEAMEALREEFRERRVQKLYLALAYGKPQEEEQLLDWDLGPRAGSADRQECRRKGRGKPAETAVQLREELGACSLLACRPHTGRRHQIRVHLNQAGTPVIGDKLYGAKHAPVLAGDPPKIGRQYLHAAEISLRHPASGKELRFECELPADMQAMLDWLRA